MSGLPFCNKKTTVSGNMNNPQRLRVQYAHEQHEEMSLAHASPLRWRKCRYRIIELMKWNLECVYKFFPRFEERKHSKGDKLSGGEKQMLAVARGLMQNPKMMLLDEITEGLAPIIVDQPGDDGA